MKAACFNGWAVIITFNFFFLIRESAANRWWKSCETFDQWSRARRSEVKRQRNGPHGSAHLNQRMPVGHRFPWIGQHFTPVLSAQGVCIVANTTHSDDLIMAHAVGAEEDVTSTSAFPIRWCSCSFYSGFCLSLSKICVNKKHYLNFNYVILTFFNVEVGL